VATTPAVVRPVANVAVDCSTGGQRAMRIAKPGLIGALVGAGVGAAGGATEALAPSVAPQSAWNAASALGNGISVYNAR
jgi:hypothetical protein